MFLLYKWLVLGYRQGSRFISCTLLHLCMCYGSHLHLLFFVTIKTRHLSRNHTTVTSRPRTWVVASYVRPRHQLATLAPLAEPTWRPCLYPRAWVQPYPLTASLPTCETLNHLFHHTHAIGSHCHDDSLLRALWFWFTMFTNIVCHFYFVVKVPVFFTITSGTQRSQLWVLYTWNSCEVTRLFCWVTASLSYVN